MKFSAFWETTTRQQHSTVFLLASIDSFISIMSSQNEVWPTNKSKTLQTKSLFSPLHIELTSLTLQNRNYVTFWWYRLLNFQEKKLTMQSKMFDFLLFVVWSDSFLWASVWLIMDQIFCFWITIVTFVLNYCVLIVI